MLERRGEFAVLRHAREGGGRSDAPIHDYGMIDDDFLLAPLAMRWLNDPANEKAAIELMVQRLKIDQGIAAQTYKFMIPENRAFQHEGTIDGTGLAEMIRLLEGDKMIPKREPWESFVDSAFIATK